LHFEESQIVTVLFYGHPRQGNRSMSSKMGERFQPNSHQSGVSLTELLVVIVVISVLAGFAMMQRGAANAQLTRQNVAQQLKTAFERARFDSVKRRAVGSSEEARVTVRPTSYTLRIYNNDVNGAPVGVDSVTDLPPGIVIGLLDGSPLTSQEVTFNMRGEAPSSPLPQFFVCNVDCNAPGNSNANIVIVTPTGTVNLLTGGSQLPTFGAPAVANVPVTTGINNDTVIR
jgi:prepilin-type N-terminal cleavage/methylation domain-containing protein